MKTTVKSAALVLALLLHLVIASGMVISPIWEPLTTDKVTIPSQQYDEHTVISIQGNQDFLEQAAVESWPGTGSVSDPITIEGLLIKNALHLFRVIDTDIHFTFRYNYLDGIDGSWCGLYLANCSNAEIVNNTIVNAAIAIHVLQISNCNLSMNILLDNYYDGIVLEGACLDNTISFNLIESNLRDGVVLDWFCQRNRIFGNQIQSNRRVGVFLWVNSSNNFVYENTILDCAAGGVVLRGFGNHIYNNTIGLNMQDGILISSRDNNIVNNVIYNNSKHGVEMYSFMVENGNNTIERNSILNNGKYGVYIKALSNGNTVTLNSIISNGYAPQACDDGEDNVFDRNYWNPWNNTDEDSDSYVDFPYRLEGSANSTDLHPLTSPCSTLPEEYEYTPNSPIVTTPDRPDTLVIEAVLAMGGVMIILAVVLLKLRKR